MLYADFALVFAFVFCKKYFINICIFLKKIKMLNFLKTNRAISVYLIFYFIVINFVVLNRFWQFEAYYFDHGIYDQSIWKVAHGKIPTISHHFTKGLLVQLGDHFTPAIYLLSPIYWFTDNYETILITHNLLLTVAMTVLYFIGKKLIKNQFIVIAIIFAFSWFIGLQNAVIANFHTEIPSLLPISLMFFYLLNKKWKRFYLFLFLTLLFKESLSALTFAIGVYLFFQKEKRKGMFIMFFSIFYYFFITSFVMKAISGYTYFYQSSISDFNPIMLFNSFFYPKIKLFTLLISFANFSFLPLLNPAFLPVILQDYFVRFVIDGSPSRIDLGLHYNAIPAFLLAISSILTIKILEKYKIYKRVETVHAIFIILTVVFFHFKLHGALGLFFNPVFYKHTKNLDFLRNFIREIPNNKGLVMTQNNLAAQMTHSYDIMLLRENYEDYKPAVVAIDKRIGQNPNNYWPLPPKQFEILYQNLSKDKNYFKKNVTKDQIIFIRK